MKTNNRGQIGSPPQKPLLRAEEVAAILNISRASAYELLRLGQIPSVRFRRSCRVRSEDLEEFIEQHTDRGVEDTP